MSTVLFDAVKTMSKITDSVLVGFSGGKESIVVLDICFRYFKNVQPYFQYAVPGLSFNEKLIKWYEDKYHTEIIRVPIETCGAMFHYGIYTAADPSFPIVSETDVWNYLRHETGIWWIAGGERINDSIMRRARIKHSGTIDTTSGRLFPVAMWKTREIYDYIKFKNLYLSKEQKELKHSLRIFKDTDLPYIKEHMPWDYEKILRVYPLAGAITKRAEMMRGKQNGKE